MIQIQNIRNNSQEIIDRLNIRGIEAESAILEILNTDKKARENRAKMEQLQSKANSIAKDIGELMKAGNREEAESKKSETLSIKEQLKTIEAEVTQLELELKDKLIALPNTPSVTVPKGKDLNDNITVLENGNDPTLPANALPHWELAAKYNLIDFELGVKITGAGFPVYIGKGARLQRALINFFLESAIEAGYTEMQVPHLVNADSGFGTGQLPDKEGQMYHVQIDDLYLIPTAEVPVTNIYRDTILSEDQLPIKNCGYTPCFRREAGSYGAHVRGLNRLHQFDKVEIVQIVKPDNSYSVLEEMQNYVQQLLQKLGLKYRVLLLCGGDMGFASAKTYDMEVWSAAQEKWLECSSVSNFETFQTNRLRCRFKNKEGQTQLAHSLNGSALALPRIMAALLENNQTENGIKIPEILVPYTGFEWIQ